MDNRKLILSFYLICSMVVWFIVRSAINYFHSVFYQVRRLPGIGLAREAVPVLVAFIGFLIALRHSKVNPFLDEVVSELKKVTWPTRDDVVKSTTVVFICILFASAVLAIFDLIWGKMISFLLKG